MSVILAKNFDINRISFSKTNVLKSGAKQAYVNYDGGKLLLQTPAKISLPFGVSSFEDKTKPQVPPVFSLDLSFRGSEHDSNLKTFYDSMEAIDKLMIDAAFTNSVAWFGKEKKRDVIAEELYSPIIKRSKDDKYPPTMKLKLPQRDGAFEAKFYDEGRKLFSNFDIKDILPRNSTVTCIIQCAGVWFAAGKFGLTWRAVQVMINSKPEALADFGFASDEGLDITQDVPVTSSSSIMAAVMPSTTDDNEVDDDEAFVQPTPAKEVAATPSYEDEEEDEEMAPIPVPKASVSKTPIVKKKVLVAPKKTA